MPPATWTVHLATGHAMHSASAAACVTLKGTVGPLDLAAPLLERVHRSRPGRRGIPDTEATLRGYSWSSQEEDSSLHLLPGPWQTLWPASLPSTDVRVTPRRHGSSGVSSGRLPLCPKPFQRPATYWMTWDPSAPAQNPAQCSSQDPALPPLLGPRGVQRAGSVPLLGD